jgi:quinone-modifying oxidoreductase subunit QmoC
MLKNETPGLKPKQDILTSLYQTVVDIATHKKFTQCNVASGRTAAHRAVFFAFIGLAITTALAVVYLYILGRPSPYPLYDPMKIIGNISGIALLAGIIAIISNRFDNKDKAGLGGYFDWFFISIVFGVGATGFLSQILRLLDIAILAYPMYYLHLIFIFVLFAYAPFSKMAHMVYRATAMVYAKHMGRE